MDSAALMFMLVVFSCGIVIQAMDTWRLLRKKKYERAAFQAFLGLLLCLAVRALYLMFTLTLY